MTGNVPGPSQQHVFYRLADRTIQHIFWDAPSNQFFADNWTQRAQAPLAAGDPATMVTPNQQHIFYRRADNGSIQHIFWDAPSNQIFTDNWTERAHAPAAAGDPATMVTPNQQHIFYRVADGTIQHIFWDAPSNRILTDNWTIAAQAPHKAAGDPATMATPNQQHIFYRLSDGSIQHIFWDAPSNRILADNWTERARVPAAAGNPATMVTPNQQHIFYRRADNGSIQHIFWDAPTNQILTDNWTERARVPAAAGNPATMVTPNQQHIFYRRADNGTIQHIFWDAPTNQILTDNWTERARVPAAAGDPATMVTPNQ